jgi:hypothetical protein
LELRLFGSVPKKKTRTNDFRLIREGKKIKLYDHRSDPGEKRDVAADHPEVVAKLNKQLEAMLASRKAK